jgi:hypothetical protein
LSQMCRIQTVAGKKPPRGARGNTSCK